MEKQSIGSTNAVETTIVTMTFDAGDLGALLDVLARYVVLARGHNGCRNVDLCSSATIPNRLVVISKWASPAAQQAHFDSADMIRMAEACTGILVTPPTVDLLEAISAHDLA